MSREKKTAGLLMISVVPSEVQRNPWNPNVMNEETFAKEVASIKEHGFVDPITVREINVHGSTVYEIIDGEHRTRAAQQLELAEIPAINLGAIEDHQAKKLTILYNELKGKPEPDLLAKLVKELAEGEDLASLALTLPYSQGELDALANAATEFDWGALGADPVTPDGASETGTNASTPKRESHEERRFVLGGIQGTIPLWLADALAAEFNASAQAVNSKTAETVLGDWLERLKKAAPVQRELPKIDPALAALGKKRKGKKAAKETADAAPAAPLDADPASS